MNSPSKLSEYAIQVNPRKSVRDISGPQKTSGLATTSLIFGFLSIALSILAGLPGLFFGLCGLIQIGKSGGTLKGRPIAIAGIILSILFTAANGIGLWLYREHARDTVSTNNCRQIAVGMLNYESGHHLLPHDVADRNQQEYKPRLSWRVSILPYLEQSELYKQFNQDEPWDSPTNLAAAKNMPEVFARPGLNLEPGMTVYQRPVGEGALFQPLRPNQNRPRKINTRMVRDRLDQTVLVVETSADAAIFWTKPDDYAYNKATPMAKLGAGWSGKLIFGMVDGHGLVTPKKKGDTKTLQAIFSPNGNDLPNLTGWKSTKDKK